LPSLSGNWGFVAGALCLAGQPQVVVRSEVSAATGRPAIGQGPVSQSHAERPRLSILVVGTTDWAIEQGADALEAAGNTVLRCHEPGAPAFPCNALIEGRICPLDAGFEVAVTLRGRPAPSPTQAEFGAVCALRSGLPLVVAGLSRSNPFAPWASRTVARDGDLGEACQLAARERLVEVDVAVEPDIAQQRGPR
jgi:hypothetical protein